MAYLTGVRQACEWGYVSLYLPLVCVSLPVSVSLYGCHCEQLSLDVTCMSAHRGNLPLPAFPHHLEHLPPSICPILACRTPSAVPRCPQGSYLRDLPLLRPRTERLAPCACRWSPDGAGSPDFYLPAFGSHAFLEISFQACRPASGLRAIPPGRSCSYLRCGPGRVAFAPFCSLLSKSCQGPGLGVVRCGEKPRSWWSGAACVQLEREGPRLR